MPIKTIVSSCIYDIKTHIKKLAYSVLVTLTSKSKPLYSVALKKSRQAAKIAKLTDFVAVTQHAALGSFGATVLGSSSG